MSEAAASALQLTNTYGNVFLHNNFRSNIILISLESKVEGNTWNDGSVGNYLSNHICVDDDNGV